MATKTLFVNQDLYRLVIDFVEENWEDFKMRCIQGGIPEDEIEEWFDEEK